MPDALPPPGPRSGVLPQLARPAGRVTPPAYRPLLDPLLEPRAWHAVPLRPLARQWAITTALLLGQGRLFAWRLDRSARRLATDPAAPSMPLQHAERYFGTALHLQVAPQRLHWQLLDTVTDGHRVYRLAERFLDAGDWSGAREKLATSVVQLEMEALLDTRQPLQQSAIYRYMLERIAQGRPEQRNAVRLATPVLVDAYFAHYRGLAMQIRADGFRPRAEISPATATATPLRSPLTERREREVGIAIGPDGELLRLLGGRHRTAIAQILGVSRMPVQVRLVHLHWLQAAMRRHALPPHQALLAGLQALAAD